MASSVSVPWPDCGSARPVDLVPVELVQLPAPAEPAGLLDGELGEHPVAGAGLLHAGVDDVRRAGRTR